MFPYLSICYLIDPPPLPTTTTTVTTPPLYIFLQSIQQFKQPLPPSGDTFSPALRSLWRLLQDMLIHVKLLTCDQHYSVGYKQCVNESFETKYNMRINLNNCFVNINCRVEHNKSPTFRDDIQGTIHTYKCHW